MKEIHSEEAAKEEASIAELLERRRVVQQWLARLNAETDAAERRIVERVRGDYERRLAETLEALAAHLDSVRGELDKVSGSLDEAEQEHAALLDALQEARLRHRIGELDDEAWAQRQDTLEAEVARAAGRETELRTEASRLTELIEQLQERAPAATAPEDPADTEGEALSEAFLAQIDRALHDEETPAPTADHVDGSEAEKTDSDTSPRPGLKCGECGYTNDLGAWFCGVCGADVG